MCRSSRWPPHHVVALREFQEDRPNAGDVEPPFGVDAVEERGFALIEAEEFRFCKTVPVGCLRNDLAV